MVSTDNEDICAYTIWARTHSKDVGGAITSRITSRYEDASVDIHEGCVQKILMSWNRKGQWSITL